MSDTLFDYPEAAEGSVVAGSATCKQSLQVAPNVNDLAVGDTIDGDYGLAVIIDIQTSRYRFSLKPKHRLALRDQATGREYEVNCRPDAPFADNQAIHHANDPGSQAGWSTEQYQVATV